MNPFNFQAKLQETFTPLRDVEILHLRARPSSTLPRSFVIDSSRPTTEQLLPPFKELILDNYQWGYTKQTVSTLFNWTQITLLELHNIALRAFLRSIRPEDFVTLQTLIISDCKPTSEGGRFHVAMLLHKLFASIKCLRRVAFRATDPAKACTSLLNNHHNQSIYELDLRKYNWHHPQFNEREYLSIIVQYFPKITDLTMDLPNTNWGGTEICFSHLIRCRNLRRLTIIGPLAYVEVEGIVKNVETDPSLIAAPLLRYLRRNKASKKFARNVCVSGSLLDT